MSLQIHDMNGVCFVGTPADLKVALSQRYGSGVNEFWLSRDEDAYPSLSIVVNGVLASLTYFPEPGHPGYKPVGKIDGLDPDEFTTFYINSPNETHLVFNQAVVGVGVAMKAAREFLRDGGLPSSVDWLEL